MVTDGDVTSQWVNEFNLGKVVPPDDHKAVSAAIIALLDTPKENWTAAFSTLIENMNWKQVVNPLRQYCYRSDFVPDRNYIFANRGTKQSQWRSYWARARYILRNEGFQALVNRLGRQIQARISRIS